MGTPILGVPGQPKPMQPGEFVSAGQANMVTFMLTQADPPSLLYIQRDDNLVLYWNSNNQNEIIKVRGRFLRADDGVIIPFEADAPVSLAYGEFWRAISLGEGWLLSLAITAGVAQHRGQTYVQAYIQRDLANPGIFPQAVQLLCQGYITIDAALGWPFGRAEMSLSGDGFFSGLTPANPSVGTDLIVRSPGTAYRRMRSFRATLTTSATVANRKVIFTLADVNLVTIGALALVPASTVVTFSLAIGFNSFTDAGGNQYMPLPERNLNVVAPTVAMISSTTANIQAGDQWNQVQAEWEEWTYFS